MGLLSLSAVLTKITSVNVQIDFVNYMLFEGDHVI